MIKLQALERSRWKNGHGSRAVIASGDGWSLSHAWIDTDSPFSDFRGMDRTCVLVAGGGLTLTFEGQPAIGLPTPGAVQRFMGEWRARARLHAGPCHVVNVMTNRDRYTQTVHVGRHLPEAGFAVVLVGAVHSDGQAAARRGDTIVTPHHGAASPDLLVMSATIVPVRADVPPPTWTTAP